MTRVQALMFAALGTAALSFSSCAGQNGTAEGDRTETTGDNAQAMAAVAELSPTQGNDVRGTVTFNQEPNGVRVSANLTGLPPGDHALLIDESGSCAAVTSGTDANRSGTSGGTTTDNQQEGSSTEQAGDTQSRNLGTITADQSGRAHVENIVTGVTLDGNQSILGSAVVIQLRPMTGTQAGDQTGRTGKTNELLACGEITR